MKEDHDEIIPIEIAETITVQRVGESSPVKQSPMEMANSMIEQKVDPAFIEKMLDLQIKYEENEAKKAFHKAMSLFKVDCPEVKKDMHNKQYDSQYISLGTLVNIISPHMSEYGLSHDWEQEQLENNIIKVGFTVTHELGYSKSNSFTSPPDTSGKKNPIQQMKSAITYLRSITFEAGMGLASTDANLSDDGNGSHEKKVGENVVITPDQLNILTAKLKEKSVSEDTILREYKKKEMWSLTRGDYMSIMARLELPTKETK